jgi:hypothetical protein
MIKYLLQTAFINRHPGVLLWNVLQVMNVFAGYNGELKSATPYSKFAHTSGTEQKEAMIPSRLGMLIIYGPAMITALIYLFVLPLYFESFQPSLAAWMVLIHFAKRTSEVMFLHKYSGSSALAVSRLIGVFYAVGAFMISATAVPETNELCSQLGFGKYCDVFLYVFSQHNLTDLCLRSFLFRWNHRELLSSLFTCLPPIKGYPWEKVFGPQRRSVRACGCPSLLL